MLLFYAVDNQLACDDRIRLGKRRTGCDGMRREWEESAGRAVRKYLMFPTGTVVATLTGFLVELPEGVLKSPSKRKL